MKQTIKIILHVIVISIIAYIGSEILNIKRESDLFNYLIVFMLIQGLIMFFLNRKTKYLIAIFEIIVVNSILYFEGVIIYERLNRLHGQYFWFEQNSPWDTSFVTILFSLVSTGFAILSYICLRKLAMFLLLKVKK